VLTETEIRVRLLPCPFERRTTTLLFVATPRRAKRNGLQAHYLSLTIPMTFSRVIGLGWRRADWVR